MKKTILISLENNNYVLKSDDKIITKVDVEKLILSGKSLYDNFFAEIELKTDMMIDVVIDSSVIDSKDKRITNDIKAIIEKTVETIKEDIILNDES